jgi:three-Cys-motif partner protein
MTETSFFNEQKEQSLIKARIVEKYFWAWAKVIISTVKKSSSEPRIAYIDLFAGAGRYKDGSKSTPVKVLETAIADPDLRNMLVSIFNDADVENGLFGLCYAMDRGYKGCNPYIERHLAIFVNYF